MKKIFLCSVLCASGFACLAQSSVDDMYTVNFKRNLIDFNIIDWGMKNVSVTYRHYFKSGKFALAVPFTYRPGKPTFIQPEQTFELFNYFNFVHRFRTGLEMDYYPTGQGRLKYFCGPSLQAGVITHYTSFQSLYYNIVEPPSTRLFYMAGINNGLSLQHLKHLNIVLRTQCTMMKIDKVDALRFAIFIGFHVGYRFNFRNV